MKGLAFTMLIFLLGVLAAALTSLSYIPQAIKAAPRRSTSDLSLKMLVALLSGLSLWIAYGLAKGDWIIVVANVTGALLVAFVCVCKLRDMRSS